MSAEDELLPQNRWSPMYTAMDLATDSAVDSAFVTMLAESWDDAESDQRNLESIDWWLARTSHLPVENSR